MYEDIVTVKILSGTTGRTESQTLEAGDIERVVAIYKNQNNDSLVRASIKGSTSEPIAKSQPIENFRSREVEYSKDGRPISITGGQRVTITVLSETEFLADTEIDFVFIYRMQEYNNQKC